MASRLQRKGTLYLGVELLTEIALEKRTKKSGEENRGKEARKRWHESERNVDKKPVEGKCLGYSGTGMERCKKVEGTRKC